MSDFLSKLNPEQQAAVTHVDGPLMIVAGAGTGKTTVVTHRIAWLIEQGHAKPEEILALTFTDKSAGEMEERVDRLLPYGYVDLQISTFHAFAEKLLRDYGVEIGLSRDFRLVNELDAWLLTRQYFDRFELDHYRPLGNPTKYIRSLLTHFSRAKDVGVDPDQYQASIESRFADHDSAQADEATTSEIKRLTELAGAYRTYQQILLEHDCLDFGDLMLYTLKLLKERSAIRDIIRKRFTYVLVDEFQDTNDVQYEIVREITAPRNNLTVVGDDDQCLPGETLVLTPDGEVPIKKIRLGDEVLTGIGKAHVGVSHVSHISKIKKNAGIIKVTTKSGKNVTVTDNHKMFCHVPQQTDGVWHYVYLMFRENLGWRIGVTTDLTTRLRLERSADRIIGVRAFTTAQEARYHETLWGLRYGIPQVCFKDREGVVIKDAWLSRLYQELDVTDGVRRLAKELNIDIAAHHFCLAAVNRGSSSRIKITIEMLYRRYRSKHFVRSDREWMRQANVSHVLFLQTSNAHLIQVLEKNGFRLTNAKKGKRLRIMSSSLLDIGRSAKKIASCTGATIEVRSKIGLRDKKSLTSIVIPAKNMIEGIFLPIVHGKEVIYDQVVKVERFQKRLTVYDIEVERTHNYIANGILVHNSIYKFRGASLANILRFETDYPNAKHVVLTSNYRSAQKILDHAYDFIQHNNPNRLEVTSSRSLSKRLQATKDHEATVEHLHSLTSEEEVATVVRKILALREAQPEVEWSDFAILVRSNSAGTDFAQALERHQIPYQFLALSGLYTKPAVLDMLAFLRVVDHVFDSPNLYRLLTSPVVGVSERGVMELNRLAARKGKSLYEACEMAQSFSSLDPADAQTIHELIQKISEWQRHARTRKVGELLVMIAKESGYLEYVNTLHERHKIETFSHLQQLYQRLKAFERSSEHPVLHNFLKEFAHERDAGEEGSLSVDLESGPDMVRIMTIHAAKGLEFRYVFVVNLVAQKFPTRAMKDAIELPEELGSQTPTEGDAHLEEERRLFYVAMTRAKQGLFFTSADDYGGARKRKISPFLHELGYVQPESPSSVLELIDSDTTYGSTVPSSPSRDNPQPTTFFPPIPKQFSFTQLAAFKTCPLQYKFAHILKVPVMGKWTFSFGKTMHNTLQRFFTLWLERTGKKQTSLFEADGELAEGIPVSLEELLNAYETCWQDDWYEDDTSREAYRQQGRATLIQLYAQYKDEPPTPLSVEQGFTMKIGEIALKGRIDRIDACEDGIEIIDYKTGTPKTELTTDDKEQLLLYQLAAVQVLGLKPTRLTYHYLTDNSRVSFLGTQKQLDALEESLADRVQGIRTSDFQATPGFHCQFCDFADICEFRQ